MVTAPKAQVQPHAVQKLFIRNGYPNVIQPQLILIASVLGEIIERCRCATPVSIADLQGRVRQISIKEQGYKERKYFIYGNSILGGGKGPHACSLPAKGERQPKMSNQPTTERGT